MKNDNIQNCMGVVLNCAAACETCATSCLGEEHVHHMIDCIMLDRQCASVCRSTAALLSIEGNYAALLCSSCAEICDACADECAKHEQDHCRRCAEACRLCAEECRKMAAEYPELHAHA